MTVDTSVTGSRAGRLLGAIASGEDGALRALEDALTESGGPLLDPLPGGGRLVTFVHLGPAGHVEIASQLTMDAEGRSASMQRIAGTDVWHLSVPVADDRISVVYGFSVDNRYALLPLTEIMELMQNGKYPDMLEEMTRAARADPFNPERIISGASSMSPRSGKVTYDSVLTLPGAATGTWFGPSSAPGALTEHRVPSGVFGDERTVTVQTPVGYEPGRGGYPLVMLLDGEFHVDHYPAVVDNLIEAGAIPPTVVAYVHNKDEESRMVEMCCNPDLVRQYGDELLPWLRSEFGAGEDPSRTAVSGCSYGGLGSAWLAYNRPGLFGLVLSLSGSFWWGQKEIFGAEDGPYAMGRDGEPQWLARQFAAGPRSATRFWIAAGTLETQPLPGGITLLGANRHLRDVLTAKGCDIGYDEFPGAHEQAGWRRTFADGLRHLLGGDPGGGRTPGGTGE
ncbi:alpha/beta hydrolase-fold protein [Streptomyces sp. NPDC051018]|uniref:alpha/beta hydrolase-fold protein n=1 Tax=Streptomyces sp. NPDC051018 TaxID=3365639 RepID=UPI0037A75536